MSHRSVEPSDDEKPRGARPSEGTTRNLPIWVTIVVVLTLTALLAWNIVVVGPEGLPASYLIGGLLGAYAGLDQYLKTRGRDPKDSEDA